MTTESENASYGEERNYGIHDASVLQVRLDTSNIIDNLMITLRGYTVETVVRDDGDYEQVVRKISPPLCNEEGQQRIIELVSSFVDKQILQANFKEDFYNSYIRSAWKRMANIIMLNMHRWGIRKSDYQYIMERVMRQIIGILTQPINAGTRASISQSVQSHETKTTQRGGGFLDRFKRG